MIKSYDLDFQRQCCKNLQQKEWHIANLEKKNYFHNALAKVLLVV
jgi:hypothetical protein